MSAIHNLPALSHIHINYTRKIFQHKHHSIFQPAGLGRNISQWHTMILYAVCEKPDFVKHDEICWLFFKWMPIKCVYQKNNKIIYEILTSADSCWTTLTKGVFWWWDVKCMVCEGWLFDDRLIQIQEGMFHNNATN